MADERVYAPAPRGRTRGGDGVVRRGEEEKAREEDTRREIEALMRELDAGEEDDAADEVWLAPPRMTRADSFATLRAMFPEVPDDALREAMERHPGDVNRAAERILCAGPPPGPKPSFATAARVEGWAPVVPPRSRARYDDASAAAEVPVGGDRVDDVLSEVRRRQTPAPAASAGGRGDDASQHATRRYLTRLHEECVVLQRSRASLSALSRAAYSRGDGRQASQLSARAAAVQIQIDAARASAAAASLKYHNANGGGGGGGGGGARSCVVDVDLHGQTADGSLRTLTAVFSGALATRNVKGVRVIVGWGRHSAGGVARVGPAVRRALEERGVRYVEENAGGVLLVPFA